MITGVSGSVFWHSRNTSSPHFVLSIRMSEITNCGARVARFSMASAGIDGMDHAQFLRQFRNDADHGGIVVNDEDAAIFAKKRKLHN